MRDLHRLDQYRLRGPDVTQIYGWAGDGICGAFAIRSVIDGAAITVIASSGDGWDHVSASRRNRYPNWTEMEQVKRLFFRDGETAMQLHVPQADHVNNHPHTLHLWRPLDCEIPRPPSIFVGIGSEPVRSRAEAMAVHKAAMRSVPDERV